MNEQTCPHLGVLGPETEQNRARDFPSFENCCFATESSLAHGRLLLADQSTYCLSGGYHQCPRFQTISLSGVIPVYSSPHSTLIQDFAPDDSMDMPTTSIPLESDYLTLPVDRPDDRADSGHTLFDEDEGEGGPSPIWLLAGTAFVTVFFLGMGLALFLGWQLIANSAIADGGSPVNGDSDTLEKDLITLADGKNYLVITATSDPATILQNGQPDQPVDSEGAEREAGQDPNGENNMAVVSEPPPTPTVPLAVVQPLQDQGAQAQAVAGQNSQGSNGTAGQNQAGGQVQQNFPAAVTPTPIVVTANSAQQVASNQTGTNQVVQAGDITGPNSTNSAVNVPPTPRPTPVPEIDVQVLVPQVDRTILEAPVIPTLVEETPTNTPEPTATWPPPIVFFSAVDEELREGKCTFLKWEVQNVRAVYVEDIGTDGKGEKEVCIKDKSKDFDLYVVLDNGSTKLYTTTVKYLEPTPTPTATWTYTPLPQPTATWTPIPPTAAPLPTETPVLIRGAKLDTAQPQNAAPISCAPGTTCEIGLYATNTGEGVDDLIVILAERSQPNWTVVLARQDGVFSSDRLLLTEIGQANTAFITLRLDVPVDAAGQNIIYGLYAASQASGEAVRSDTLILNISIP